MGPPIGIDLGTAYTRVAVFDGNEFTMIPDHHGNGAMPSYVAFTDTEVLIGESARKQAPQNPTNTIFDIIRLIGRPYSDHSVKMGMRRWPFKVGGTPDDKLLVEVRWKGTTYHFTPVEICSMILTQVKENAERKLGVTTTDAVITVPVYFTYNQRQAINQAGLIAGLNFLQIIGASSASAMFYSMEGQSKNSNVFANITRSLLRVRPEEYYNMIIFDLGAGTLDVSLVTIKENVCKVRASAGDVLLGGSDFDNNMVDYFVRMLEKNGLRDVGNIGNVSYGSLISLRTLCEKAKISLSSGTSRVPMKLSPIYGTVNLDSFISGNFFGMLNKDLFSKCIEILKKCLGYANIDTNAVNEVILAGGSAKIPWLRSHIGSLFKRKDLNINDHNETATAYGAALHAFNLIQRVNGSTRFLLLKDVTPFFLGVKYSHGVMDVFIPQNTSVPTRKEKVISLPTNKTNFLVEIYEGEGSLTYENYLGKFELLGALIPNDHGITVCFEIHDNGTLTVTAEEMSSKKGYGITSYSLWIEGIGGSTRIPKVHQLLKDFFNGKELCDSMNIEETVAYGATVQAAMLCGNTDIEPFFGLKVENVTSYSLWIEGTGGVMSLLVPEGTPIPIKKELLFSTYSDDQMSRSIAIRNDKGSRAVFTLSNVPTNPTSNSEIAVNFEIDNSGFVNLTAKSNEITISEENGGLTKEEIQEMIEAAARYEEEDAKDKVRAAGLNYLENLAYKMKSIARGQGVSAASKKSVEEAANDAIAWLETNYHEAAVDEINARKIQLEAIKGQIAYLGTNAS